MPHVPHLKGGLHPRMCDDRQCARWQATPQYSTAWQAQLLSVAATPPLPDHTGCASPHAAHRGFGWLRMARPASDHLRSFGGRGCFGGRGGFGGRGWFLRRVVCCGGRAAVLT